MISVQMYDVDGFGRAIFCDRGCVLFFPCPLRRLHLQNVHFEALALAPMFFQFLDAAEFGRTDDMVALMNEGIDLDFDDHWVRVLVCCNPAIVWYSFWMSFLNLTVRLVLAPFVRCTEPS